MPVKAIPIIVTAVVATSIVIYNNREQILELVENVREKLSKSLHEFGDFIGPRQREAPYGSQSTFDEHLRREEEAEGFLRLGRQSIVRATGQDMRGSQHGGVRQRGHPSHGGETTQPDQVLFDTMNYREIPMQNLGNVPPSAYGDRLSSTAIAQNDKDNMPPPPLLPRRSPTSPPKDQPAAPPSESGYGTEQTNLTSPAINPQPSFVARQQQQPSQSSGFIMPAMAVVGGAGLLAGGAAVANSGVSDAIPSVPTTYAPSTHSPTGGEAAVIPPVVENQDWIQEWANNTGADEEHIDTPGSPSIAGSMPEELEDIPDTLSEFGTASDGGFSEVGSWTEVGSDTSENDH